MGGRACSSCFSRHAFLSSINAANADIEHRADALDTALASHHPTASYNADPLRARHDWEGGEGEALMPVMGTMAGGEGERNDAPHETRQAMGHLRSPQKTQESN